MKFIWLYFICGFSAIAASTSSVVTYVDERIDEKQTVLSNNLQTFTFVTNALGYLPGTNGQSVTSDQILAAFGYTPLTNTAAAILNYIGFVPATNAGPLSISQVTNGLGFVPLTNSSAAITATEGFVRATNAGPISSSQVTTGLGYTPASNNFAGITNSIGYFPATNTFTAFTAIEGFTRATNGGPISSSQVTTGLGYTPLTNTAAAILNYIGFAPATNAVTIPPSQIAVQVLTNYSTISWTNPNTVTVDTLNATNSIVNQLTIGGGSPTITTNIINTPLAGIGFAGHPQDVIGLRAGATDMAGTFFYTNTTATTAATLANRNCFGIVTFSKTYSTPPKFVIFQQMESASVTVIRYNFWLGGASTTNFLIGAGTSIAAGTNYGSYFVVW